MTNDPARAAAFLRNESINLDLKEDCAAAATFREWIRHIFPEILSSTDIDELDVAQLRIAQEYNLRRRGHSTHRFELCLLDVLHEWMDLLWDRQRSIAQRRIFQEPFAAIASPNLPSQALYLGEEEEEPARPAS